MTTSVDVDLASDTALNRESRLGQLIARYDDAKATADAAAAHLKHITDGIKTELATAMPGETAVVVRSTLLTQPLQLTAKHSWRVDAPKLKREQPQVYAAYAREQTVWELRRVPTQAATT